MNKTLFAFDFDNTIMFSKFEKDMGQTIYRCCDKRGYLYTTTKVINLFNELKEKGVEMVLITARNYSEIECIEFFNRVPIKYVICSLGYKVYIDGTEDLEWLNICSEICSNLSKYKVDDIINKILKENIEKVKLISDGYAYALLKTNLSEKQRADLKRDLDSAGYELLVYNKKIKVISKAVNKGSAFEYLKKKYFINSFREIIAAGDDLIDISFLQKGTKTIVPKDSNLEYYNSGYIITEKSGVYSTEEILEFVVSNLD